MKTERAYLEHIRDSLESISEYTQGLDRGGFLEHRMVQDAVLRKFETIGEAARQIPEDYRRKHPEVPWGLMIAVRNRLIHAYFDVDLGVLWNTITQDLSGLRNRIEALLQIEPTTEVLPADQDS